VNQILKQFKRFLKQMIESIKRLLGMKNLSSYRPTRRTISWVIPKKLAVGSLPKIGVGDELLKANIKVVFSLCSELEGTLPDDISQNFKCLRLVLPDRHYTTELTVEQLAQAVEIVRKHLENDLPVYVHCLAGIERSPTVCIAYLCRYQNLKLWEAVSWLKQVHPRSMPSTSELRVIREFIQQP
jgi:atypical dual specificity phosphatase